MATLRILRPDHHDEWLDVLKNTTQHDFYHLPEYHALAEGRGEGRGCLVVYQEAPYSIAIPLLLRPVSAVAGLDGVGGGWRDATSVYGYAGPVTSHDDVPAPVLARFREGLTEALHEQRVVNLFSRLHPLLVQQPVLAGLGECASVGQTVSIDLTLPLDVQFSLYRANHKRGINRLRAMGATCEEYHGFDGLGMFMEIYHQTMRRVGAHSYYFFDTSYVEQFIQALAGNGHLFLCVIDDTVVCGGVFTVADGIVQYHLGGTKDDFLPLSPMKFVFDTVRRWATEQRLRVLHLGGGFGARDDSLFHFKAGFSNRRHETAIWRWVLVPDVHRMLCDQKAVWRRSNGLEVDCDDYFPAYRDPTEWTPADISPVTVGSAIAAGARLPVCG